MHLNTQRCHLIRIRRPLLDVTESDADELARCLELGPLLVAHILLKDDGVLEGEGNVCNLLSTAN